MELTLNEKLLEFCSGSIHDECLKIGTTEIPHITFLIKQGADVNTKNKIGETPLHLAAKVNLCEIGELLLKNGANPKIIDNYENCFHTAVIFEKIEFMTILFKHDKTLINIPNTTGDTPLHLAFDKPNNIIEFLIKNGADPNIKNSKKQTPIEYAKSMYCEHNSIFMKKCYDKYIFESLKKKRMLMNMLLENKISFRGKHKTIIEQELGEYDIPIEIYYEILKIDCSKYELSKLDEEIIKLTYKVNIEDLKKKKHLIELILEDKIKIVKVNEEEIESQLKKYDIPISIFNNLTMIQCTQKYLNELTEKLKNIEN